MRSECLLCLLAFRVSRNAAALSSLPQQEAQATIAAYPEKRGLEPGGNSPLPQWRFQKSRKGGQPVLAPRPLQARAGLRRVSSRHFVSSPPPCSSAEPRYRRCPPALPRKNQIPAAAGQLSQTPGLRGRTIERAPKPASLGLGALSPAFS